MSDAEILTALKVDLQISASAYDAFLGQLITSAKEMIAIEGITLDEESVSDGNLVRMYASYLYRSKTEDKGMPRSLRYALNNRLFSEKGSVE